MKEPKSVANVASTVLGSVCLMIGIAYQTLWQSDSIVAAALFVIACYVIPVASCEVFVHKVHARPATGLNWENVKPRNPGRVLVKLVGLFAILTLVCFIHAIFRFYDPSRFTYAIVAITLLAPFLLMATAYYFVEIDRRMENPEDGYYAFGSWVLRLEKSPNFDIIKSFVVGWAIKGFFLPVMFAYLALNMPGLAAKIPTVFDGPVEAVLFIVKVTVIFELTIVVVGYSMTLRLFDAHIRSPNMLLGAWVLTLICYEPFNRMMSGRIYNFNASRSWADVIEGYPLLMWPWLAMIIMAFLVWIWATAIFGLRWSNLTHRGVISNGPYRYTKHPDYMSKSIFFWLTAAPFATAVSTWQAVTLCAGLLVVNAVYYGRARLEEQHLSADPEYVAYALAMNERSIFAPLARRMPFLMYRSPDARTDLDLPEAQAPVGVPAE
ncbi:MAG: isoprenylcysteine carboxylmethyltransferase family protein [Pseudomonadota bacterium]